MNKIKTFLKIHSANIVCTILAFTIMFICIWTGLNHDEVKSNSHVGVYAPGGVYHK